MRPTSRHNASTISLCVILALVVALAVLDHFGSVDLDELIAYWPFVLVLVGVALLWGRKQTGEPKAGLILIGIGVLMLSTRLRSLDLSAIWPLALVAVGAILVWRSFERR